MTKKSIEKVSCVNNVSRKYGKELDSTQIFLFLGIAKKNRKLILTHVRLNKHLNTYIPYSFSVCFSFPLDNSIFKMSFFTSIYVSLNSSKKKNLEIYLCYILYIFIDYISSLRHYHTTAIFRVRFFFFYNTSTCLFSPIPFRSYMEQTCTKNTSRLFFPYFKLGWWSVPDIQLVLAVALQLNKMIETIYYVNLK